MADGVRTARPKRARKRATRKKKLTFEARRRDRRRRLRGSTRRQNKVDESEDAATSSGSDTIPIDLEESNLDAHEAEAEATSSYEMTIIVFYGPEEVARHRVTNRYGCRLFYSSLFDGGDVLLPIGVESFERLFGDLHRAQIVMPTPRPGKRASQENVGVGDDLSRLLETMERGLLLDMHAGDIFATALGRCAIYCSDRRSATTSRGRLERDERTKVYDYDRRFAPSLRAYAARGEAPSTELYFTFGQTWNDARPTEENLLSVAVVHEPARRLVRDAGVARACNVVAAAIPLEIDDGESSDDEYFVAEAENDS